MPLGIDFYMDLGVFRVPEWNHVGTKTGSKIDVNFEKRFLKNRPLAAARAGPKRYPIGRSDGVPPPALNFQSLWAHFGIIVGARFARRNFKKHLIKFRRSKGHSITLCCWRGGGVAALLRCWISAPGPKAPSCVSACVGTLPFSVCSPSKVFLLIRSCHLHRGRASPPWE